MGFLKQAEEWGLDQRIDGCQKEMIEKLTALVAIPSIATEMTDYGMPYGPDIANALHYALALAEELGFATHNEDDRYGWAETGDKGPWWESSPIWTLYRQGTDGPLTPSR